MAKNDYRLWPLLVRAERLYIRPQHFPEHPDQESYMTTHPRNFPSIDPAKLEKLAETAIRVGLRLEKGQDLFLTAPIAALPLVRKIAAEAYKAGAGLVTPMFSDEETTLARFRHAPDASFDRAAGWLYEGMAKAFAANTARLAIVGDNPMLLAERGPRQGGARQPRQFDRLPAGAGEDRQLRHQLEHRLLPEPGLGEAGVSRRRRGGRGREARGRDLRGLAGRWRRPGRRLGRAQCRARAAHRWLNGKRFAALHYSGPGTDLTIGLADGHVW